MHVTHTHTQHIHTVCYLTMSNSNRWLEFGAYVPNLVYEEEKEKRTLMGKQMTFWKDKRDFGE